MRKFILRSSILTLAAIFSLGFLAPFYAHADEEVTTVNASEGEQTDEKKLGTNISLSPVSKVLQISSNSVYEDHISVTNDGENDMQIEVYAAPYSYVYSEDDDTYKLGFNKENSFTQITRWITFKNSNGEYVKIQLLPLRQKPH